MTETTSLTKNEIKVTISKHLKAPRYDLKTNQILKELLELGINYYTQLFNVILKVDYFPPQWKMAQIIMIPNLIKIRLDHIDQSFINLPII